MDSTTLTILIFLATHTGALLWWGGRTSEAVKSLHELTKQIDKRLTFLERKLLD